jgi:tetratricopeptide (TPR) repeat protein
VEALADVSLLTVGPGWSGEPRIAMLGLVRDVAVSGLESRGELDEARRRHCEYYVTLAEEAASRLRGPEALTWTDRLAADEENLREALEWSSTAGASDRRSLAVRLAVALGWYWYTHGSATEGRARIESAIGDGTGLDPRSRAEALHALGVLEQQQGANELAVSAFRASLGLWRSLKDARGMARELNSLGVALWAGGQLVPARQSIEESIAVARDVGDDQRRAAAISNIGILELSSGRHDAAIAAFQEALAIDTHHGDRWAMAVDQCNLGTSFACAGQLDDARGALDDALARVTELGDTDLLMSTLEACALLACASGDHECAVVLVGGSDALRRAATIPRTPSEDALLERELAPARAALGQDRYGSACERGANLSVDELVAQAAVATSRGSGSTPRPPPAQARR